MNGWLRRLTRIHHYHYLVVVIGLFVATVLLGEPGAHELTLGPFGLDAFWVGVGSSLVLFLLSATDEYDPTDYGFDREK